MRSWMEDGRLVLYPEGRMDSSNAAAIAAGFREAMAGHPDAVPLVDAGALTMISSTGLRVLLTISRELEEPLAVRNVSDEVYEIFRITGFTSLLRITRRLREISVDGCPEIGHGAVARVYRLDVDTIVKVYRVGTELEVIEAEMDRARQAFLCGIPTAISFDIVRVGSRYGAVFEMLRADNLNDRFIREPDRFDAIMDEYAQLIRTLHGVEISPGLMPDARRVYLGYLDQLRGTLPEETESRLRALLEAMPEDHHAVHGDIQMKNVMYAAGEPLLIDMETLSAGDPVFEYAGLYNGYVAFTESDPDDTVNFFGFDTDCALKVYRELLARRLKGKTPEEAARAADRAEVVGRIRFLFLIAAVGAGKPELKESRIRDSVRRLETLLPALDTLTLEG